MLNNDQLAALDCFASSARNFCKWAESSSDPSTTDMNTARRLLIDLHSSAVELPDIFDEQAPDAPSVTDLQWQEVLHRFSSLPLKGYWDVFNPLEKDEAVFSILADDLSDIYRDVKSGLLLYEEGHLTGAAWEWRFSFLSHWGDHLVGAQRAIHWWFADYRDA